MATCPYCGAQVADTAAFCTQCGGALMPKPQEPAPPTPTPENPAPPSAEQPQVPPQPTYIPPNTPPAGTPPPYTPPTGNPPPYVPPTGYTPPTGGQPYAPPPYNPYGQPSPYGYPYQPNMPASSGQLNTGLLIWSILNIILCCTPLGIAGLVYTIMAHNATSAEEEAKRLDTTKTLNLIGTIGGFIAILLFVIIGIV